MSFDLHQHSAGMNLRESCAVGANWSRTIDFMPGTFVTEHQQRRIGGRELYVVVPVSAAQQRLHFTRFGVDGDKLQRSAFGETVLHHFAFSGIRITARRRRWRRWLAFMDRR